MSLFHVAVTFCDRADPAMPPTRTMRRPRDISSASAAFLWLLASPALAVAPFVVVACGGTVTSVGSVLGADSADASVTPDAAATTSGADAAATPDASADASLDAHVDCTTSQCVDFDGSVLCDGQQGHRACPDGHHTEACTCGGTAPSHWTNCAGGCP